MSIQVLKLRPYFNEKIKKIKLSEEWVPLRFDSISHLFKDIEKDIEQVPEAERYNIFYTMGFTKAGDRKEFISTDVIAFDIDHIFLQEKEAYLEPISAALKVDLRKCIVVWTGNGIQILIKLKESAKKDIFSKKAAYKYWIDRINKSLLESGLPGNADPSIFDSSRVLRLPFAPNIKPMESFDPGTRRETGLWNRELEYCGWELGEGEVENKKETKSEVKEYGPVDVKTIMKECLFLNHVEANQESVFEPLWRAGLGLTAFFQDKDKTAHQISSRHPQYSQEETQSQVERIRSETSGPRLCKGINALWGGCKDCKWNGKVKTPLQLKSPEFFLSEVDFLDPTSKPSEMQIVAKLLKIYHLNYNIRENYVDDTDGILVQYAGELFSFDGKIWKVLEEEDENLICQVIHKLYNFKATSSKIESTFKTFKKFVPHPPKNINFFQPTSSMSNFENGTLTLKEDEEGNYSLSFKEHSKLDYLTNIIPGIYDPTFEETNPEFEEMLQKMFQGDIDKDEKIRMIAQMYGAALMPYFPHLFFLYGVAGGGKSTICTILHNLLEKDNICGVQPHEFEGFNLESMAGKLVNMVTDISSKHTIGDDIVKQIEDKMPFRIRRKNKKDFYAPLPSIHIFGANKLPKNFEGESRAHDRRWSLCPFNYSITEGNQNYRREFGNYVFKKNPQGILNFAIKGLIDLIKCKGHYFNPASGKAALNEWQTENDICAQFIEDFGEGCLREVNLNSETTIFRTDLWNLFEEWRDETGRKFSKLTRNKFYKMIKDKGFETKFLDGYKRFVGIGREKREEASNVTPIRF